MSKFNTKKNISFFIINDFNIDTQIKMKSSALLVQSFFKQLMKYPVLKYYSKPHTIQSSVGLIFRFPNINQLQTKDQFDKQILTPNQQFQKAQLLFVQRAGYALDHNIVFPGGQCDNTQTDLQACQRQLTQQIGIDAKTQCIHLGQLPSNFYYLKKRGKQVHISCHIYCLKSTHYKWQPKLNSEQLRQYKWVKLAQLFKQENYIKRNQVKLGVFERVSSFASKIARQNITSVAMPQLNLGMDRNLWGLTLWIWSYVLQMSLHNSKVLLQTSQIQKLQKLVNIMKGLDLQFKPRSIYKYPVSLIASGWHYFYRVMPFTYRPRQTKNKLKSFSFLLISLLLIVVLINYYCAWF